MSKEDLSDEDDKQQIFFNINLQNKENSKSPHPEDSPKPEEEQSKSIKNDFLQKKTKPEQSIEKKFVNYQEYYTTSGVRDRKRRP